MGGKNKQSQRTKNNVRPSSSGRSAELLGASLGVQPPAPLFPTLLDDTTSIQCLNSDFAMCIKKLNKKDPITKTKALVELKELAERSGAAEATAAVVQWARVYTVLCADGEPRVREAAQRAQAALAAAAGRGLARGLRALAPAWLAARYDGYPPAAAAAHHALQSTFPGKKLPELLSFCKDEVMTYIIDNILHPEVTVQKKEDAEETEESLRRQRLATTGLQLAQYVCAELAREHGAWLWGRLCELLRVERHWRLARHHSPLIRSAWFGCMCGAVERFPVEVAQECGERLARAVLAAAAETRVAPPHALWQCLRALMHHHQDCPVWEEKKKELSNRILDLLENGGCGASQWALPLLSAAPPPLRTDAFHAAYLAALLAGLQKKSVLSSKMEREAWLASMAACQRHLGAEEGGGGEGRALLGAAHGAWLRAALRVPDLLRPSAAEMRALLQGGGALAALYWHNVASTLAHQLEETAGADVDEMVCAHVALLQTLRSQTLNKRRTIRFQDDPPQIPFEEQQSGRCEEEDKQYVHEWETCVRRVCVAARGVAEGGRGELRPLLAVLAAFPRGEWLAEAAGEGGALVLRGLGEGRAGAGTVLAALLPLLSPDEQRRLLQAVDQMPWRVVAAFARCVCESGAGQGVGAGWVREGGAVRAALAQLPERALLHGEQDAADTLLACCVRDCSTGELLIGTDTVHEILSSTSAVLRSVSGGLLATADKERDDDQLQETDRGEEGGVSQEEYRVLKEADEDLKEADLGLQKTDEIHNTDEELHNVNEEVHQADGEAYDEDVVEEGMYDMDNDVYGDVHDADDATYDADEGVGKDDTFEELETPDGRLLPMDGEVVESAGRLLVRLVQAVGNEPISQQLLLDMFELALVADDQESAVGAWRAVWEATAGAEGGGAAADVVPRAATLLQRQLRALARAGKMAAGRAEHAAALWAVTAAGAAGAGAVGACGAAAAERARALAVRYASVTARLSCPLLAEVARGELSVQVALLFAHRLVFRAALLAHPHLLRRDDVQEEVMDVLHDFAVLDMLHQGYKFWRHYDVLEQTQRRVRALLSPAVVSAAPSLLHALSRRARAHGYLWPAATRLYTHTLAATATTSIVAETNATTSTAVESVTSTATTSTTTESTVTTSTAAESTATTSTAAESAVATPTAEPVTVIPATELTGDGYFHIMQTEEDPDAALQVMVRGVYLWAGEGRGAGAGEGELILRGATPLDAVIDVYYHHNHLMLYEREVSSASWLHASCNTAIVEALRSAVGWDSPPHHWDFTTITLCSLLTSLQLSSSDWHLPQVAMLGGATLRLYCAVSRAVAAVPAESQRRQPAPHVAHLPVEWDDIFAPDLVANLFRIVVHVLESAREEMSSTQAVYVEAMCDAVPHAAWRHLPPPHRRALSLPTLARLCARTLRRHVHAAYKLLAYYTLETISKELVVQDGEKILLWSGAGATEEPGGTGEEGTGARPAPELCVAYFHPSLQELEQQLEEALAHIEVGVAQCKLEEGTASHSAALGYLLLQHVLLAAAASVGGELAHHYGAALRAREHAGTLLRIALRLLPAALLERDEQMLPAAWAPAFVTAAPAGGSVARLACRALLLLLAGPAVAPARHAWAGLAARAKRRVAALVRRYVAPVLLRRQLGDVRRRAGGAGGLQVEVLHSTREVVCRRTADDRVMELRLAFSATHPLEAPRCSAQGGQGCAGGAAAWLPLYLAHQGGSAWGALRLWQQAVTRRLERAPSCYICYCRLHPDSGRLPAKPCATCHNKFHNECIKKWFETSKKTECPVCRSTFKKP